MTDLTMSQFASKDDLLAAQAARIAELESQLDAIGAGGVEPLRKPALQVLIDFDKVGAAGPFAVVDGRVRLPAETMMDLARMLKPTSDAIAAAPQAVQHVPWCPDVCPITGRKFFMWIEHWATGKDVPTYGGPYDSYTIPVKEQDGTFTCERYDHDAGEWMTEGMGWECVGVMLVDDQSFVVDPKNPRYMEIEEFATQPAAQGMEAQQYRLIERGELIEAGDQFLRDDFTWQIDPQGIFVGMPHGAALRPARRALAAQAKQGGAA